VNLLKLALAAEQWAAGHASIALATENCLNARDKDATCDRCLQVCPTAAITLEPDARLDASACIQCGLCFHACPTGVFHAEDGARKLLHCVSQIVDHETVEIVCKYHPTPSVGNPKVDAVVKTNGCLSRLGASAYLGLFAIGVKKGVVRLDACAACPLAALCPQIEATISEARELGGQAVSGLIIESEAPARRAKTRTVYSVLNPPVSRRGLLRMMALQGVGQAEDVIAQFSDQAAPDSRVPAERRRQLAALRYLSSNAPLPESAFTQLQVSEACTACGLCARVCPTGALAYYESEGAFALTFATADCVNCGLCTRLCEAQALQTAGLPPREDVLDGTVVTLYTQSLKTCKKCHATFKGDGDFCPSCDFRRKNPFGYVADPREFLNARR
jgi:ferredoxin